MTRRTALRLASLLGLALCLSTACATIHDLDLFDREGTFDEAWKGYVRAMRWKSFDTASQYVAESERAQFLEDVAVLRPVHLTDHEYGPPDFNYERSEVTVRVTYRGYNEATLLESEFSETEHWIQDPTTRKWVVRPDLSGFKRIAEARPPESARP